MDIECHACIGGTNVRGDLAKLEQGQHIVVGTPGRVHDMINRKALGLFVCMYSFLTVYRCFVWRV